MVLRGCSDSDVPSGYIDYFPLSVNKISFDHFIFESQDTHKVFKTITLRHVRLKSRLNFYCVCHNFRS